MKLIKEIDFGFATKKYYDLGASAGAWERKILVVSELENGQGSKRRHHGNVSQDADGKIRINLSVRPYNTKIKGLDY